MAESNKNTFLRLVLIGWKNGNRSPIQLILLSNLSTTDPLSFAQV